MYYFTTYLSPLGPLRLISDGEHLTALSIEKQKYACSPEYREALQNSSLPVFQETIKWLAAYFAKEKPSINALPLSPEGSAFRQEIWRLLCEIPYGQVTTYGCPARQAAVNMEKKQCPPRLSAERWAIIRFLLLSRAIVWLDRTEASPDLVQE